MDFAPGDLALVERFVNETEPSPAQHALRALLLANNGEALDTGAVGTLEASLTVVLNGDGHARLVGDDVVGELLAIVAHAQADGTWQRMKACPACGWAFYDRSRNRSRTWCTMAICGNRAKARSYRARHH
jgi:predicted RNA-binding Zn ribbon-like protein